MFCMIGAWYISKSMVTAIWLLLKFKFLQLENVKLSEIKIGNVSVG